MTRIRRGGTYRHRNCLDLDLHVVRINYIGPDYFKLQVAWINRNYPEVSIDDRVTIERKDLPNWEEIPHPMWK